MSTGHMVHPYTVTLAKLASDLVRQGHLRQKSHNLMVEANTHLKPFHTSMLDKYKVF